MVVEKKYFYQDGYSAQEKNNELKWKLEIEGKTIEQIKKGIVNLSLNESHYGNFSIEFWKDENLIWECLNAEHDFELIFNCVRKFLWRDKVFVLSVLSEKWFYPLTNIDFQDQKFDYYDYIHASLKKDEDVISALEKLKNLKNL